MTYPGQGCAGLRQNTDGKKRQQHGAEHAGGEIATFVVTRGCGALKEPPQQREYQQIEDATAKRIADGDIRQTCERHG